MPDILTHLLIGASLGLLIRKDGEKPECMLIILGALLIDIERPITWLLATTPFFWIRLGSAFHSILGAVVLSYFVAGCFTLKNCTFREQFKLILIGCTSHLLLDMVMYPWAELGLQLLYPLKITFSFHLLWPDYWFYPLFGGLIFGIVFCITYLKNHNNKPLSDV